MEKMYKNSLLDGLASLSVRRCAKTNIFFAVLVSDDSSIPYVDACRM